MHAKQIVVPLVKQGVVGRFFDLLMKPLMYWLQGNWYEEPQRTHFWNNSRLTDDQIALLDVSKMVICESDKTAVPRKTKLWGLPIFHMPRFGGWKKYIVVAPKNNFGGEWYIGWFAREDSCTIIAGYSNVPIIAVFAPFSIEHDNGFVRVLVGQKPCLFFGLNSKGEQIEVISEYSGRINEKQGEYSLSEISLR